ncbi:MAG: sortase [Thermomicrobiales bacterium]
MTDDAESAVTERTDDAAKTETADQAAENVKPEAVAVLETESETEPAEAVTESTGDDGDSVPPPDALSADEDGDAAAAPVGPRRISQWLGTLLIAAGFLTIALTVGITAWHRHQQDAETQAFLSRVSTPPPVSTQAAANHPTPFPSTVSGVLVPDTARTPTANVATRAAQPVATTSNGLDRSILVAPVAPTPTPQPVAPGSDAPTAAPTPPPRPKMPLPTHIQIPAIKVDSDIVEVGVSQTTVDGQDALIWDVAPYAVGHNFSSASPGEGENVVLSGHDDWQGEVFKNLYKLKKGDEIDVQAGDRKIAYHVDDILLLPEVGETLEKRVANAAFIGTTGDERLTLVTCYPYGVDSDRIIVIARPNQ